MATGNGNLPNPTMSFSPFAILTAEEMNNIVENINALADGTGIGDGSVGTSDIANNAVTSSKIDFTTLGKFSAQRNAPMNVGTTATRIAFDTELYDIGGGFNPATGIFTCPTGMGGYWSFSGGIHVSSLANQVLAVDMRKNGVEFMRICRIDAASGGWAMYASGDVLLAPGDTVDLIGIVTGTARPLTGGSYQNYIMGHQLSRS